MNLPKTDFPMRGNLPINEPKRLEIWDSNNLYEKILEKNKEGRRFVLHDGPPYANGPIHIGHAFNKILKDFVIKSHAQRGFYTPYIPGWDCHGQPIEHMVEKSLGPEKMSQTTQVELRSLCRKWAGKYVDIQREGFKRLGINADWQHPYLTYTPDYEAGNVEIFKSMYLSGSIYRGRKPIHWCKRCHTALAEAEIEYGDCESPSIYVRFKLDSMPQAFSQAGASGDSYVLIWTTTPWTLPANTAVCLSPDADYVMVCNQGYQMIMAKSLVEQVASTLRWVNYELITCNGDVVVVSGRDLCGTTYTCPIRQDLKGTLIYGKHVMLDSGTGCVHTAPGHGQDDYLVGIEFNLPLLMPVDDDGKFCDEAGICVGMDVDAANPKIIEWLTNHKMLAGKNTIVHSYPHCWRCHEPVIFRATEQWFVSMDKNSLRDNSLQAIKDTVNWIPAWAKNRIASMVSDRPDWCISRQRAWGVPIPVFSCKKCGSVLATEESFDAVIKLFYDHGSDAWFSMDPREYLPSDSSCPECGAAEFIPEKDILDVWWESGVSHTSVCKHRSSEGLAFPADMYLEGSDQHRGWFQSSLLTSIGAYKVPPYKSVMHCGFTVDEQGRKMSKSLGNGIDPADVTTHFGADVLRLWVASVDYSHDVSISENILKQVSDIYRRIRNTFRFLLGNLYDFNPAENAVVSWDRLEPIDRYMLYKTSSMLSTVEKSYNEYRFSGVYRCVIDYVNTLSSVYMDVTKDRLYSEASNSHRRRSVQTVLFNSLDVLVRVLSPILSFTCDEVWENYPPSICSSLDRPISSQLSGWPDKEGFIPPIPTNAQDSVRDFDELLAIREFVTKALEAAREEGRLTKSQQACATLYLPTDSFRVVSNYKLCVLEELFIVSEAHICDAGPEADITVSISSAKGEMCPRCWNYRVLGLIDTHPDVCARCAEVLESFNLNTEAVKE